MFDFITRVSTKGRSSIFQDAGQFLRQFAGRRAGSAGGERVYAGSYRQGAAETTNTGVFKASATLLSKHTDTDPLLTITAYTPALVPWTFVNVSLLSHRARHFHGSPRGARRPLSVHD